MTTKIAAVLLLAVCLSVVLGSVPLDDSVVVREWLVVGPFPAAPREGITGTVEDPGTFSPAEGDSYRTSLVQGGVTTVRRVLADSLGRFNTDYQDVRWDSIQDYYGIAGLSCAGYAYAEFACPRACRALAVAPRVGSFTLNGLTYLGDVYGNGWFAAPVPLDSGRNRVLLRLSGFGDQDARLVFVPPPAPAMVIPADATLPDLPEDSALTAPVGIPVLNTTESRLDSVWLRIGTGETARETLVSGIPAFGVVKVLLALPFPATSCDTSSPLLKVPVTARFAGIEHSDTLRLAVRRPGQPLRQTFVSAIDSSCQYYAVLYPAAYDPTRRYALVLTLHGAGVEAWGQANAYKPKDWAFVVAPTNRRPYGFDWQDWGRLDAIEVLDTVLARLPIDPDRVLLTGGSMGGHGDWHVGLTHPDRFAAVAPQAGWPTHQLYVPWFLQRSAVFAQPSQLAIRDRALRSDNAPALLRNAANLPFFILHGGDDDNVPTLHARNFAAWLEELGLEFIYKEVPGRKHWWTYEDQGVTVVDDTSLMNYIRDKRRVAGPRHVYFRTGDLGTAHRSYWLDIERVSVVGQDAVVEALADDSVVRVSTENVEQLRLDLDERLYFSGTATVEIDGTRLRGRVQLPAHLTLHRSDAAWSTGPSRAARLPKLARQFGPAKQATMSPFALVYGTRDQSQADLLRHAATQEAMRWWLIGNGAAAVLPDSEVTGSIVHSRNLVLYGGPDENLVTARVAHRLPIRGHRGRMHLGSRDLGDSLAAVVVYPNPANPDRLVLVRMGTDPDATKLSLFWGLVGSSTGLPDFVVYDRSVRRYGWAGMRAAGFFDSDWQVDERSAFIQP